MSLRTVSEASRIEYAPTENLEVLAVSLENVGVRYRIPSEKFFTFK